MNSTRRVCLTAALLLWACTDRPTTPHEPSTEHHESGADAQAEPNRVQSDAGSAPAPAQDGSAVERSDAAAGGGGAGGSRPPEPPWVNQDAGTSNTPPQCVPSGGGAHALLEGETVQVTLTCSTGAAGPHVFEVARLPDGAELSADTSTLTWTPRLDQAGRHEVLVYESGSREVGTVRFDVVDRFDAPDNVPVDPMTYHEEYGLPVLHLTTGPDLNEDTYAPATIIYRGHSYDGTQAKLRGATSKTYPKRSLTLKFTKLDKFNEPSFAGGFLDKRKVVVTTTFDDNAYVRQRLCYELWNRLDPSHIKVQAYNAVLFRQGKYYGLYTVSDHIDGYLMEDFGFNQDGDLYKARTADVNFRATLNQSEQLKPNLHVGFTKEEGFPFPPEPGAFDTLDGFMQWVIDMTPEQLAAEADSRIAVLDYIDWWVFVSFLAADDSVGKNSYHYRDPLVPGSLWRYVPWDLNHSLGQQWNTTRVPPSVTRPEGLYPTMNALFEKMLKGPLLPEMRQRYGEVLATGGFQLDEITALYDAMIAEVDASARRDELKWAEKYRTFNSWKSRTDFTTFEEEAVYVRRWLRDRHAYLSARYPVTP
jgi:spore coat protein H